VWWHLDAGVVGFLGRFLGENRVRGNDTISNCAKLGLQVQSVVARVNFSQEGTRGLYQTFRE
jgi:hypothetical protein